MEFNISHSSTLNLVSRSLGFKDYNTYKALNENSIKNKSSTKSYQEYREMLNEERLEEFSTLDDKFIKVKSESIEEYDIFINKNADDEYYLIFRLDNSYTRQVYYCPHYDTFELDIYQNYMYEIKLEKTEKKNLRSLFFNKLLHIERTKNFHKEIIGDLMELMDKIFSDREKLMHVANKYSKSDLLKLWQSKS